MSDEKKLSDDLNDMLGDAKEGAKKAAHKAEEFADEAKEKAKEFANEAKETFTEISKDGKNVAIIAHIWFIGWVVAFIMNNGNKTELGSIYLRQTLGVFLISLLSWIPILGWIVGFVCFIMWVMSLISALNGEKKPVFLLGEQFQDWFKSL